MFREDIKGMATYHGTGILESIVYLNYTLNDTFDISMLDTGNSKFKQEEYDKICKSLEEFFKGDSFSELDELPCFYEEDGKNYMSICLIFSAEVELYGESYPETYDEPGDFEESMGDIKDGWLIENEKDFEKYKDDILKNLPETIPVKDVSYENSYVREDILRASYEKEEPDFDYDYDNYEDYC